jgi:Ca2+-binding EF-hand superfamily protein
VVHIPQRSCFALPNMTVLKEAHQRKAASGMRGELMSGPSDHELAELRKTFDSCDLNGDGFINPEEFHALLIRLDGDVSREECQLDFDVADSEGDGYIGFKEFVVWWTG